MANKRQKKNRQKNAEEIKQNKSGTNAPDTEKKSKKRPNTDTDKKTENRRSREPQYVNPGINRFVNKLVVDDEKQEKKEARKRSLSKYNIFAKTEPRKKRTAKRNDSFDFLGKNNDVYGDEYYDRSAMRKMQKKRKKPFTIKMLRRRKFITCGLLLVAIVFTCIVLSLTVLFRTEGYTVIGSSRYEDKEIIDACGISLGENIFIANKKAAEERLVKNFPYISEVKVSASFPDKIKISITEGKQSYQVRYSGKKYCVVSAEGRILKLCNAKVKKLPTVKGVKLKAAVIGAYVEYSDEKAAKALEMIVTSIAKNSFNGLSEINIKNKANITIKYDGRIKIKLGLPEDIDYKIRTAIAIINEKLDPNHTGVITGNLDVSTCNKTKRSYFNEIIPTASTKPESTTEASTDNGTFVDNDNDGIPDDVSSYNYYTADPNAWYSADTAVDYGTDTGAVDYGTDTGTVDYGTDTGLTDNAVADAGTADSGIDSGAVDYGTDSAASDILTDGSADSVTGW